MTGSVPLYRITDVFPYLSREEEYTGLTLEEAAIRMDELTGVGADVILADFEEPCDLCDGGVICGTDAERDPNGDLVPIPVQERCPTCHGTGKRRDPWEFVDPETGREVVMRREVE